MNRTISTLNGRSIFVTEKVLMRYGQCDPLLFLCRIFSSDDVACTYKQNALCFALVTEKNRNYPSKVYNYVGVCGHDGITERDSYEVQYASI